MRNKKEVARYTPRYSRGGRAKKRVLEELAEKLYRAGFNVVPVG